MTSVLTPVFLFHCFSRQGVETVVDVDDAATLQSAYKKKPDSENLIDPRLNCLHNDCKGQRQYNIKYKV